MSARKSPGDVLRDNWSRASRATLTVSVVLFLLSRGQRAAPNEFMKALGVDWSGLNPYAIGLFGVPVVAVLCLWTIWWAWTFARSQPAPKKWYERVATKTDLSKVGGDTARTLARWSLVLYVFIPVIGLMTLEGKFLNGAFSFSTTNQYSCLPERSPQDCLPEGSGLAHFWPPHGLRNVLHTPYRYQGNLTYLPPWQAIFWVALGLGVIVCAARYCKLLIGR
jgi:hypothetical protein